MSSNLTEGTIIGIDTMSRRRRLTLIFLSGVLLVVLAVLAIEINSWWMTGLDTSVWNWFDAHRSHRWQGDEDGIFTFIGKPVHVAIAGLVSGALLALQARDVLRLVVVTGTVGAGAVIEQTLKATVERSPENLAQLRNDSVPDWSILDFYAHSFPSGHVTGAATLFGTIAVCLGVGRSRAVQILMSAVAVAGVLTVAWLALYVRAHIFTDVIGGMILGGALVALAAATIVTPTPRAVSRPHKRQIGGTHSRTV
ncbi:phosphatase PAP2 family protein [Mycolicibacterium vinylchloridicum]|uniref:phosphatase PAP2 family protein n=1 Tax=Mycolicibacterium vinylchloridicum TaxID=2736928 RepID=UPI0015C91C9D|nr:phosphatase PAP2 family protein [Mycolicibacterium vinylchloridicum]